MSAATGGIKTVGGGSVGENWGTGPLRDPARALANADEGVLIDASQGLQSRVSGTFKNVVSGNADDAPKYLWTIDERGVNIALEQTPVGGNSIIKHTNLSSQASIGGEVRFGTDNIVTINVFSGRFGVGAGVTDLQWANTISKWESLGYKVIALPYK